jgi:hypothetical protein
MHKRLVEAHQKVYNLAYEVGSEQAEAPPIKDPTKFFRSTVRHSSQGAAFVSLESWILRLGS